MRKIVFVGTVLAVLYPAMESAVVLAADQKHHMRLEIALQTNKDPYLVPGTIKMDGSSGTSTTLYTNAQGYVERDMVCSQDTRFSAVPNDDFLAPAPPSLGCDDVVIQKKDGTWRLTLSVHILKLTSGDALDKSEALKKIDYIKSQTADHDTQQLLSEFVEQLKNSQYNKAAVTSGILSLKYERSADNKKFAEFFQTASYPLIAQTLNVGQPLVFNKEEGKVDKSKELDEKFRYAAAKVGESGAVASVVRDPQRFRLLFGN